MEVLRHVRTEAVEGARVRVEWEEAAITLREQCGPACLPCQPTVGLG